MVGSSPAGRRIVALLLLAAAASLALAGRLLLAGRYPHAPTDWWRPQETAVSLDPEVLAHAALERRGVAQELAERRRRVLPVPERLKGGHALIQAGHAGGVTAAAWSGTDLVTAGADRTVRFWRPDRGALRLLQAFALPGLPSLLAADAERRRVWVALEPDTMLVLSGKAFDTEWTRHVGLLRPYDLRLADGGLRAVLLDVWATVLVDDEHGGWGYERFRTVHFVATNSAVELLKHVDLPAEGVPVAATLSPDGEIVAQVVDSPAGPAIELRRADDGSLVRSEPFALPWWAPGEEARGASVRVALGPDFLAVADARGIAVQERTPDGGAGAWVYRDGGQRTYAFGLVACNGAVGVARERPGAEPAARWEFLARSAGSWEERPGPDATRPGPGLVDEPTACNDDASRIAFGKSDGGIVVHESFGFLAGHAGRSAWSAVAVADGGQEVRLFGESGGTGTSGRLDLRSLETTWGAPGGAVRLVDAERGDAVLLKDVVPEPEAGPRRSLVLARSGVEHEIPDVPQGGRVAALRGGIVAILVPGRPGTLLLSGEGVAASWTLPRWLGGDDDEVPWTSWTQPPWSGGPGTNVSLSADGRTATVTDRGGFAVFRAGVDEPLLFFEGLGYEDAPADVAPDGSRVVVATAHREVEFWSVETAEVERSLLAFPASAGRPTALRFGPDGEMLFLGSSRGAILGWDGRTGNPVWRAMAHDAAVSTVVPLPARGWLVTSDGLTVVLSELRTGESLVVCAFERDRSWAVTTTDGYHVSGGRAGQGLVGLRFERRLASGWAVPADVVLAADDPDLARLGNAVDAIRVTLIGRPGAEADRGVAGP